MIVACKKFCTKMLIFILIKLQLYNNKMTVKWQTARVLTSHFSKCYMMMPA